MEGTVGEIRLVGFNYDPINWVACDGRKMNVKDYTPLFALIGCNFGGDGVSNGGYFNVPKLDGPSKNLHYIMCVNGYWPSRD